MALYRTLMSIAVPNQDYRPGVLMMRAKTFLLACRRQLVQILDVGKRGAVHALNFRVL